MINQDLKVKAWKDKLSSFDGEKYVVVDLRSSYPNLHLENSLKDVEDYLNENVPPMALDEYSVFKIVEVCSLVKGKTKVKKTEVKGENNG